MALAFGAILAGAVVIDYGVKSATKAFASGGSTTTGTTGKGATRMPVSGKGITWERTDQGVDASGPAGTPIYAVAAGTVSDIVDFYQGQPGVVISSPGLPGGATGVYYAEQITPSVHIGEKIAAGQQIGVIAPSGTG
jgi:murein DD-endopeptidase MepM/ murein hydrolase activator NlpD